MARQLSAVELSIIAGKVHTAPDLGSLKNGDVNKYARYKAVESQVIDTLTEEQFIELNYGLTITNQTIWSRAADINYNVQPWTITYNKPNGISRLTDWSGYATDADLPIKPLTASLIKADADLYISLQFGESANPSASVPMIGYIQQNIMQRKYLGVVLFGNNPTHTPIIIYSEDGHFNDNYELLNSRINFKLPSTSHLGQPYIVYAFMANELFHNSADANKAIWGSEVSSISGVKILPFECTRSSLSIVAMTFGDYITATAEAHPIIVNGRYFLRITIQLKYLLGGTAYVGYNARWYKESTLLSTKTGTATAGSTLTSNTTDYETTLAVYNNIMNGATSYKYQVDLNYNGTTKSLSGNITNR